MGTLSLSNGKGVMLCSMPPVGSSRKETFAKPTSTAAPLAPRVDRFVTGRVHAKVGYIQKPSSGGEQAAAEAARVRTERKIYNVLSKHKRWLAELKRKKQKQADEENQVDDEVHKVATLRSTLLTKKACVRRRILSHEDMVTRNETVLPPALLGSSDILSDECEDEQKIYETKSSCSFLSASTEPEKEEYPKPMKSIPKPAWALTAKETEAKGRDDEEREVDSLLDFARELSFDKYIEDAEIQSMMEQVKKRIAKLGSDAKCLERRNSSSLIEQQPQLYSLPHKDGNMNVVKPVMDLSHDNLKRWNQIEEYSTGKKQKDAFDTQSIAQSVLSKAGQSTRTIHSRNSLAVVVGRMKNKLVQEMECGDVHDDSKMEKAIDVKVAVHLQNRAIMKPGQISSPINLPYLNRNPAV